MARGRRKVHKASPRRTIRHLVARRRRFARARRYISRARGGYRRKGSKLGITGGWLGAAAKGIGTAAIAEQITMRVAPQFTPVAKLGAAYLGGGVKGVIGEVVYETVTGQMGLLSGLGGLFGGSGGNGGMAGGQL